MQNQAKPGGPFPERGPPFLLGEEEMPRKTSKAEVWERQQGESARAFEAFSLYLEMGADRSVRAVGQKLGKSRALVERWSSAHQWVDRCRAWDNHLQHEAKKAAVAEVRAMNRRHVQMAQQIQVAAITALTEMGSGMVNPKNFTAIVKLATELERKGLEAETDAVRAEADSAQAEKEAADRQAFASLTDEELRNLARQAPKGGEVDETDL